MKPLHLIVYALCISLTQKRMAMTEANPRILSWARETAGLSLEAAAERLNLGSARGEEGHERLAAIEAGTAELSRPLLLRMAKQYRRPLVTFYLAEPPPTGERGADFRTLPPDQAQTEVALVDALIRDIKARQEITREILEEEDSPKLPFIASMKTADGPQAVLNSIMETIDISPHDYRQFELSNKGPSGFAYLRQRVESSGIFVMLLGNLGSHHTNLSVEAFRGFAMADPVAPFIVINDQDAETAWAFTLLHELAHLWLGLTGVSGSNVASKIEKFCNDVAAKFFVKDDEAAALHALAGLEFDDITREISVLANTWKVSHSMVAYKLLQEGVISSDTWVKLSSMYRASWLAARQVAREKNRDREGGPNFYLVRRHRIGPALVSLAARAIAEGAISPSRAAKLLGVKPSRVYSLLSYADQAA